MVCAFSFVMMSCFHIMEHVGKVKIGETGTEWDRDSLVPYMMASCRSPDIMFRRVCQVAAQVGSGLAVEPQLCLSGVTLKDDGMPGQTTGQHGHRRHRATGGCPIVCTVVLTTEWATTGQHGLTSSLFSYFLCRWHANSPSVLGRCHMDK